MCSTTTQRKQNNRGDNNNQLFDHDKGVGRIKKEPKEAQPLSRRSSRTCPLIRPAFLTLVFVLLAFYHSTLFFHQPATTIVVQEEQVQEVATTTATTSSPATTTATKVYYCGYDENPKATDLYTFIFPEHQTQASSEQAIVVPGHRRARLEDVQQIFNETNANGNDVLVISEWGCNRLKAHFLRVNFPGKIIRFDLEGIERYPHIPKFPHASGLPERQYMLGMWSDDSCRGTFRLTCLAQHFNRHAETWPALLHPKDKPQSTRERFLIYAHTNCVAYRERAFDVIAETFPHKVVEYAGRCSGQNAKLANKLAVTGTNHKGHDKHHTNYDLMSQYRFCLVMENTNLDGYITEKILNAFVGGCIPVYYGTPFIFEIFNPKAFIYYNISNPQPALAEIARLEQNETAYLQVMQQEPILLNGNTTIDQYLALSDDILPNSTLKRRIREMLLAEALPPTTERRSC